MTQRCGLPSTNPEKMPAPLVHQGSSGLPRRRFLRLVRELGIPHRWVGRLCVVRLRDLESALGLAETLPTAPVTPAWSPEALRARLLAGGKGS